jgi:hypothetical protein
MERHCREEKIFEADNSCYKDLNFEGKGRHWGEGARQILHFSAVEINEKSPVGARGMLDFFV